MIRARTKLPKDQGFCIVVDHGDQWSVEFVDTADKPMKKNGYVFDRVNLLEYVYNSEVNVFEVTLSPSSKYARTGMREPIPKWLIPQLQAMEGVDDVFSVIFYCRPTDDRKSVKYADMAQAELEQQTLLHCFYGDRKHCQVYMEEDESFQSFLGPIAADPGMIFVPRLIHVKDDMYVVAMHLTPRQASNMANV